MGLMVMASNWAKLLLESAGFKEVTVENIPFMDGNVLVKGTTKKF
jgi:hypothetical protein